MDKINYYGVSRADYQACQEQIDRHATTYLVFVVLVAVLLTDKFWTTGAFYLAMLLGPQLLLLLLQGANHVGAGQL
ncbi:hypothetical protein ACXO9C_00265 [Lactobacillus delbrueckii subsp. bulgaricus]|uniref:hypothetical protein n=1 Tax=Lactobacillus delbrueckii TaxID=1584 RepID=UPI0037C9A242